ncbi:MAG: hypothetical protein AAF627_21930 [Myxococcota bacterium]
MRALPLMVLGLACVGCGEEMTEAEIFSDPAWRLDVTVDETRRELVIEATFRTIHADDFVHLSIRKEGWDNDYPGRSETGVDWSRPNRWFGELHPDTYLEGSIYPGPGDYERPPKDFRDYTYRLSLDETQRTNWPDEEGSIFSYTTQRYSLYDDQRRSGRAIHPGFGPGRYEVELYAWYTGPPDTLHPTASEVDTEQDITKVQYIHLEHTIARTQFTID